MNPVALSAKFLVTRIKENSTLVTNLTDKGVLKVVYADVPNNITDPYVWITHVTGGYINNSPVPEIDIIVRLVVVSRKMGECITNSNVLTEHIVNTGQMTTDRWHLYALTNVNSQSGYFFVQNDRINFMGDDIRLRMIKI